MRVDTGQIVAGKYQLVRRLARGGMGAVWRARHVELDVDIALKVQRGDTDWGEGAEERFRREARAAAQLKSPHVVHIYDYGIHHGSGYIAMELLEGEDLGERLSRVRRLPPAVAVDLVLQAALGVRAAHERGLVHRDIKPSNLFLSRSGGETVVKVLDFGIAKDQLGREGETTQSGVVFGSPAYMSPEQARGAWVDQRTDVWSLGAVLYRMLTGCLPFDGSNQNDIIVKLCTQCPAPPSAIEADLIQWDEFFRRVMARDPAQRPSDVDSFRLELARAFGSEVRTGPTALVPVEDGRSPSTTGRDTETAPLSIVVEPGSSVAVASPFRDASIDEGDAPAPAPLVRPSEPLEDRERRSEPRTVATVTSNVLERAPGATRRHSWTLGAVLFGAALLVFALVSALPLMRPHAVDGDAARSIDGDAARSIDGDAARSIDGDSAAASSEGAFAVSSGRAQARAEQAPLPAPGVYTPKPELGSARPGPPSALGVPKASAEPRKPPPAVAVEAGGNRAAPPPMRVLSSPDAAAKAPSAPPAARPEPADRGEDETAPPAPGTDPVFGLPLGTP